VIYVTALSQSLNHSERAENGELLEQWRFSMVHFLAVELEAARIFAGVPVRVENPSKAIYVRQALKAYEVVLRFSDRIPLSCSETERIQEELDFLRSRLECRTEGIGSTLAMTSIARNESLATRVAGFLVDCKQVRANARRMVVQNHELMRIACRTVPSDIMSHLHPNYSTETMPNRAAILLQCSQGEARQIRSRAKLDHRRLSNYILSVVMPTVAFEEALHAKLTRFRELNGALERRYIRGPGPRTNILLRCSREESKRIRKAAEGREMTISGFLVHSLRRSWAIADQITARHPRRSKSNDY
jgi:uncharacterized protein (DUF1778 family)